MRVAFFTPRTVDPLHPRLMSFKAYFKKQGTPLEFITMSGEKSLMTRINWLSLWFFDYYAINKCKPLIKKYDIIFITDLKYLPLAKYARNLGKIVIYDTIDHNVNLRFYQLENKFKFFKIFKKIIIKIFQKIELRYASRYCHEILVNSISLQKYFKNKAHILFYSSPFETLDENNKASKPVGLLYLGIFSPEKGGYEILNLQKKLNFPLFIFGDISTPGLQEKINVDQVHHTPKISIQQLEIELQKLLSTHYLVGFSLIKPAHFSYEVQEANKDIDYLALGIPLIGNYRLPTKEKIDNGCGLFFDDHTIFEKLSDHKTKETLTETCKEYYSEHYASRLFYANMEGMFTRYKALKEIKPFE